ncbi:hypothetical protein [Marisediminicola senii]|uniref:hypothetical protein n=1 Tax=Marisediminicola senii TaxID=2711233 RepID=UPI0013ED1A54|nr:hypothetical protein [Marisediminicola senii]
MVTHPKSPPARGKLVATVAALVVVGVGTQLVLAATAANGDPFDSPLYPWTWLVLPLVAALASVGHPGAVTPLWFTAALVVPSLIGTVWLGASDGSGLWAVGLLFVLVQGVVVLAAAYLGGLLGRRSRRKRFSPRE